MNQLLSAKTPLPCHIICHSTAVHLNQVFTGLTLLDAKKIIRLKQSFAKNKILPQYQATFKNPEQLPEQSLLLLINQKIKVFYETSDGNQVNPDLLSSVDFYFKRSYEPEYLDRTIKSELRQKIFPLGFNYGILTNQLDFFKIKRDFHFRSTYLSKLQSLLSNSICSRTFRPKIKFLHQKPKDSSELKILFMVRAWDPCNIPNPTPYNIAQCLSINETRAECIAKLREKFKEAFLGGFIHTPYAKEKYKNLLLNDNRLTEKSHYLNLLKTSTICIATTGLHGSVGWKMGEYIAHSKAIVSEKFNVVVPGDFSEGQNYLSFANPEEAINQVQYLIERPDIRNMMMKRNFDYYCKFLHPEALMLNSLNTVLNRMGFNNSLRETDNKMPQVPEKCV